MGSHRLVPCTRLLYLALCLLSNLGGGRGKGKETGLVHVSSFVLRGVTFRHSLSPHSPLYFLPLLPISPSTALTPFTLSHTFCFLEISLERTLEESKI